VRQADTHDAAALTKLFDEVGTIDHLVSAAVGGERTLKPFLEQTLTTRSGGMRRLFEPVYPIWQQMAR
jgi:hypothetical protein